ncbi:MAG: hypothetical protein K2Z81_07140 [Cyanobacteria bacterium]|nr:hypothetical protein [Cyanobacteriota bacterium]
MSENTSPSNDQPLLQDVPSSCIACQATLCLRQQVINLALGNVEELKCLSCLGQDSDQTGEAVLSSLKEYIDRRECFKKQWSLYIDEGNCPDPVGCFPRTCFCE